MNVAEMGGGRTRIAPVNGPVQDGAPMLAQCLDALPMPVKTMNAAAVITFYNRAAFQYFGPRVAWALQPHERDVLFHPADQIARHHARDRVLSQGECLRVELRAMRYDYSYRWHSFELTPLFDSFPNVVGMMIVMSDIHDKRRMNS